MLIGVAAVVLGGFVIICAAPFTSPRLYKTGGGLFLVSGTAKGAQLLFSATPTLGRILYLCATLIQLNVRDETSLQHCVYMCAEETFSTHHHEYLHG